MATDSVYRLLGGAIATRRRALGLTQAELASKIGISRASIANIESGRQSVLLHHVYALAAALEVPKVTDLLPPLSAKTSVGELKMTLSNQELSNVTLSEHEEAQITDLIMNALAGHRGPKAGS